MANLPDFAFLELEQIFSFVDGHQVTGKNFSEMEAVNGVGQGHGQQFRTSEQGPEKELPVM